MMGVLREHWAGIPSDLEHRAIITIESNEILLQYAVID